METREEIRARLQGAGRSAQSHMDAIRESVPLSRPRFREHMCAFVQEKFLLTPPECLPDCAFDDLALISLARTVKLAPEVAEKLDTARSCDGATSVMAKKVLLFMAVQKALDIELPAEESARIKTLSDLCDLVWDTLAVSPVWADRLKGDDPI